MSLTQQGSTLLWKNSAGGFSTAIDGFMFQNEFYRRVD